MFNKGQYNAGVSKGNEDHFTEQHERGDDKLGRFQKRVRPTFVYISMGLIIMVKESLIMKLYLELSGGFGCTEYFMIVRIEILKLFAFCVF